PARRATDWRSRACSTTTSARTARPASAATSMRSRCCWRTTAAATDRDRSAAQPGQRVLADLLRRIGGGVALHHLAIRIDQELGEVPLDRLAAEDALPSLFSHLYSGSACSPLTSILANIGKVTSYWVLQKFLISVSSPGSWWPNWSHGKPSTTRPRSRWSCHRVSSPWYCGVKPHLEATLTISNVLPRHSASGRGLPSISRTVKS